jgi:Flp pilus assembly protein TadD
MADLEPPDSHHFQAATGWMELGNRKEASAELDKIAAAFQDHPEVLAMRWTIFAELEEWEGARGVAQVLVQKFPDQPSSWINLAYATRRTRDGGLEKAREVLLPAAARFQKDATIPYNLACYASQFGRLDEAWDWLRIAARAAGKSEVIKQMALKDPDLKPLWTRVINL